MDKGSWESIHLIINGKTVKEAAKLPVTAGFLINSAKGTLRLGPLAAKLSPAGCTESSQDSEMISTECSL